MQLPAHAPAVVLRPSAGHETSVQPDWSSLETALPTVQTAHVFSVDVVPDFWTNLFWDDLQVVCGAQESATVGSADSFALNLPVGQALHVVSVVPPLVLPGTDVYSPAEHLDSAQTDLGATLPLAASGKRSQKFSRGRPRLSQSARPPMPSSPAARRE